jgi:hypothetical protein
MFRIADMAESVIYLDNAATTFPKPHEVLAEKGCSFIAASPWRIACLCHDVTSKEWTLNK